jgi:hypothetical protein
MCELDLYNKIYPYYSVYKLYARIILRNILEAICGVLHEVVRSRSRAYTEEILLQRMKITSMRMRNEVKHYD